MSKVRTSGRPMLVVALAGLLLCACAAAPPRTPPQQGGAADLTPVPTIIDAVIVDARPDAGTLTVKEEREHATWLVSLPGDVRIFGPGRPEMKPEDLGVGDHVRVSGTSRVDLILNADEIELLEAPRGP